VAVWQLGILHQRCDVLSSACLVTQILFQVPSYRLLETTVVCDVNLTVGSLVFSFVKYHFEAKSLLTLEHVVFPILLIEIRLR
jgi:hypothetical protein